MWLLVQRSSTRPCAEGAKEFDVQGHTGESRIDPTRDALGGSFSGRPT
jgi:hypothetical protein